MKKILDENINYIVSGIERSGTSMLMQILNGGDIPVAFDLSRPEDKHNPKGYFELEGGKIINKLIDGSFSFEDYKGEFIKITAYGLKFLPPGNYKIIYSERNIEEILDSMEKMTGFKDTNREETRNIFLKLNKMVKSQIEKRNDIDVLFVNYNSIINDPDKNLKEIIDFLELTDVDLSDLKNVIDSKLYRQRRNEKITIPKNGS
jgi:hypothetical protein